MKEKMKHLLNQQRALIDAAKAQSRDLTEEEKNLFDEYQTQLDRYINSSENLTATERTRASDITALCRDFGIDPTDYIQNGVSIDAVRMAVLEDLRRNHAPVATGTRVTRDEGDKFRAAAADALLLREGLMIANPVPGAQELRAMRLRDLAIECLRLDGDHTISVRTNDDTLFSTLSRQFFNPTAAFPSILDQTIRKAYVAGYDMAGVTFDQWTSTGSLSDFKESQAGYLAGSAGQMKLIPENGELEADVPQDYLQPTRKLNTYGRQFTMSRAAFINDDIGYLTTIPARYAASARTTINNQVYGILSKNPVIYDGVTLFHQTHENLMTTGTDLTVEAVQAAIIKMRMTRDPNGNRVNIIPRYLVVPVGYEFKAYAILSATTVVKSNEIESGNPLVNLGIEVISDVALNDIAEKSAVPWFLAADRNSIRSIQVDYLNGQAIPNIRRSEKAGQLGYVWDIFLDWGVSVIDYRGLVKNPGVKLNL